MHFLISNMCIAPEKGKLHSLIAVCAYYIVLHQHDRNKIVYTERFTWRLHTHWIMIMIVIYDIWNMIMITIRTHDNNNEKWYINSLIVGLTVVWTFFCFDSSQFERCAIIVSPFGPGFSVWDDTKYHRDNINQNTVEWKGTIYERPDGWSMNSVSLWCRFSLLPK